MRSSSRDADAARVPSRWRAAPADGAELSSLSELDESAGTMSRSVTNPIARAANSPRRRRNGRRGTRAPPPSSRLCTADILAAMELNAPSHHLESQRYPVAPPMPRLSSFFFTRMCSVIPSSFFPRPFPSDQPICETKRVGSAAGRKTRGLASQARRSPSASAACHSHCSAAAHGRCPPRTPVAASWRSWAPEPLLDGSRACHAPSAAAAVPTAQLRTNEGSHAARPADSGSAAGARACPNVGAAQAVTRDV